MRYQKEDIPNLLSDIRFWGSFGVPILYYFFGPLYALIWFIFLMSTDAFDGWLARIWKCASEEGGKKDRRADGMLTGMTGLCVLVTEVSASDSLWFVPLAAALMFVGIGILEIPSIRARRNIKHSNGHGKAMVFLLEAALIAFLVAHASPNYWIHMLGYFLLGAAMVQLLQARSEYSRHGASAV